MNLSRIDPEPDVWWGQDGIDALIWPQPYALTADALAGAATCAAANRTPSTPRS